MLRNDRLANLIEKQGISNAQLGKLIGLSPSMIGKLVRGETHNTSHIYTLATALGTSADYLMGTTDDPAGSNQLSREDELDVVKLPLLDLKFGMGGGTDLDPYVDPEMMTVSRSWVRAFTKADPAHLFIGTGVGDSMMPTIHDGDLFLCDRSQTRPLMSDQIWAITFYGMGMIKRLRPGPEGSMKIMSDNPAVSIETATDGEMTIIGRVIAIMRRV